MSRHLAGAVVLGGGAAPAPTRGAWGCSCASSIRLAKKNARCPGLPALRRPEGLGGGWLSCAACSREGQEEEQSTSSVVFPRGLRPVDELKPLGNLCDFRKLLSLIGTTGPGLLRPTQGLGAS
jgi:hypothetical protein